ncbi:ATP-dependent RNA helicase DHX36-like [Limulus polyphemus]|uniref:RNA helicase n=1 Tax=Limulus polyphemus TaxID=6850 RepID=A0ABM1T717_LIMPO|nr:ATP-dependent RNA helicase DHX36-like [Limulus polyphemus]
MSKLPREKGSILYCTTGILLQRMQNDPYLSKISHIILDEIHERDLDSEFLIIILKDLLKQRQDLKVILMSATLNAEQFSQYFGNCPMLNIPGFTFPVKEYLLEDVLEMIRYEPKFNRKNSQENMTPWKRHTKQGKKLMEKERERQEAMGCYLRTLEGSYSSQTIKTLWDIDEETIDLNLIFSLLRYICIKQGEGAVLVFLPGWEHISKLHKIINDDSMFNSSRYLIIPLHSLMPTVNQKAVFNRPPPGVRKIILATNIAETRVQEGICYHLYSKLTESQLQNYQLPEILRTRLETLCLRIKILKLGKIEVFLNKAMQPPDPKALELSINLLEKLNALDEKENLTPLGFHLAQLPLDPHTGKMILMGAIFSCLDPILTVAASLSFKDAFVIPLGKEEQADQKRKQIARNSKSDHLMLVQAFQWLGSCYEERLRSALLLGKFFITYHATAMADVLDNKRVWIILGAAPFRKKPTTSCTSVMMLANLKKQFTQYLHELQFLHCDDPKHKDFNRNSENQMLLKAVICAGLYPNVAKLQWRHNRNPHKSPKIPKVYTEDDGKVVLHPKSVNYMEFNFHSQWLVYYQKLRSSKVFLHDTTNVQPFSLLFFGGRITFGKDLSCSTVFVDKHIAFHCPPRVAHLVKELREELDKLLQHKANHPGVTCWDPSTKEGALLKAIVELITSEDPLQSVEHTRQDDDYDDDED